MSSTLSSPFKFLDAYTAADRAVFFGRDQEVQAMYSMVFKTRLLLVYGPSGVGKTSLVQCGLASRFDGPDWYPFFIRRERDLNESLLKALSDALQGQATGDAVQDAERVYDHYQCPPYLIFDQFEELLLLGSEAERRIFFAAVAALLESRPPLRVMFIMREEFIGRLQDFEAVLPTLFDFRIRIEPMNTQRVKDVLQASFTSFNISLDPPADARLAEILANVRGDKSAIHLPFLQIYLDTLYKADYLHTYGERERGNDLPPLEFTAQEISKLGTIVQVLDIFFHDQVLALRQKLASSYPQAMADNAVGQILDLFVTEAGTKAPLAYTEKTVAGQQCLVLLGAEGQELLPQLPPELVGRVLLELQSRRLLRISDTSIELAHDSLVALIDEQRSDEQRQLNEIKRRLDNSLFEYQKTGEGLTRRQYNAIEPWLGRLSLSEALVDFIAHSRAAIAAAEQAELQQKERELDLVRQKLAAEQRAGQRQRLFSLLIGLVAIVALVAGWWARQQQREAIAARERLRTEVFQREVNQAAATKAEGRYEDALQQLALARSLSPSPSGEARIDSLVQQWEALAALLSRGDSLAQSELTWRDALASYAAAYEMSRDEVIRFRSNDMQQRIEERFSFYLTKAQGLLTYDGCRYAVPVLRSAQQLKPTDETVSKLLERCAR